jgi:acyl-CoA thioesterase FadM
MQKIVFNGHYLMYFDTAVAGYWRALALPYRDHGAAAGRPVHAQGDGGIRGAGPLRRPAAGLLRCARIGNSSVVFEGGVFRGDELLVRGELVYVFADPATMVPKAVPPDLRDVMLGFEAGKPMVDVRVGTWDELGREAQAHPQRRVHRRAEDPGRDGMGRRRRRMPARGGLQPLRHGAGHRPAAGTCARHGQDRPHGGAAPMRGSSIGRAGAGSADGRRPRPRRTRGAAACAAPAPPASTSARGSVTARAGVRRGRHRARGDGQDPSADCGGAEGPPRRRSRQPSSCWTVAPRCPSSPVTARKPPTAWTTSSCVNWRCGWSTCASWKQRRGAILKSIDEQGKLTPELRAAIEAAPTKQELEDLYLPFKVRSAAPRA